MNLETLEAITRTVRPGKRNRFATGALPISAPGQKAEMPAKKFSYRSSRSHFCLLTSGVYLLKTNI